MPKDFAPELSRLRIDSGSATPAYAQISDALRSFIECNPESEGLALPSERVLCKQFDVSRMTLRHALATLERLGLIRSVRGCGTFIAAHQVQKQQQEFRGFSEEMATRGAKASSRLLSLQVCPPDSEAREFFALSGAERVYRIERLRLADEVPMVVETVQVLVSRFPDLARFDLEQDSLYRILEEEYGIRVAWSTEEIGAVAATARLRALLNMRGSTPLLQIARRTYTSSNHPIELACSLFHGERYRAVVHSNRLARR